MLPFRKILCPTDFSAPSHVALAKACELAAHFNAPLSLFHVVPPLIGVELYSVVEFEKESLDAARAQMDELAALHIPPDIVHHTVVRLGITEAEEIVREADAEGADLIVMSTHGLTGWRHMVFGSVTENVLHLANCPVLVVRTPQE